MKMMRKVMNGIVATKNICEHDYAFQYKTNDRIDL